MPGPPPSDTTPAERAARIKLGFDNLSLWLRDGWPADSDPLDLASHIRILRYVFAEPAMRALLAFEQTGFVRDALVAIRMVVSYFEDAETDIVACEPKEATDERLTECMNAAWRKANEQVGPTLRTLRARLAVELNDSGNGAKDGSGPGAPASDEARALAAYVDDPGQSMTELAEKLSIRRQRLYEMPRLRAARDAHKHAERLSRLNAKPRGRKNPDTGDIEAFDATSDD